MHALLGLVFGGLLVAESLLAIQGEKSPLKGLSEKIGVAGVIAGLLAFVYGVAAVADPLRMFLYIIAGLLMALMGITWGFGKVTSMLKLENPLYIEEGQGMVEKIQGQIKILSIIGLLIGVLVILAGLSYNPDPSIGLNE